MSAFEEQELKKLAAALSSLTPRPAHLDRDGILFEAGRRSVRPSRVWPLATLGVGLVACGLAVALMVRPEAPPMVRSVPTPQPEQVLPSPPAAAPQRRPENRTSAPPERSRPPQRPARHADP